MATNPVIRTDLGGMDLSSLDVDVEEVYEGAGYLEPEGPAPSPETDRGALNHDSITGMETSPDQVILWNVRFPEQQFYLDHQFVGFISGQMMTDRETAERIKVMAPHVYEEPKDGPIHEHAATKFKTRSFAAYIARRDAYDRELG